VLKKVEITNFKNFNEKFTFDLSDTNNFEFNKECIQDGIVNTGVIYGHNGCGKSNLGLAIFDLVWHVTDKYFKAEKYHNYLNANSTEQKATFKFTFLFGNNIVEYQYTKSDIQTLITEELKINNEPFLFIDKNNNTTFITTAKGAENLNKELGDSKISIIAYISKNTILEDNSINNVFKDFENFIHNMLFFKTLDERYYIGYEEGMHNIQHQIIEEDNLTKLQELLNKVGIDCTLKSKDIDGKFKIFFVFKNKEIEFDTIASSGTKALVGFYFWYQKMKNEKGIKFVFIDEFDAFYHHDLSAVIIEMLREITNTQIILTTHNTSNISNDILRPDCYFIMDNQKITSLKERTHKELREAHNIEKMYRAGSFE